LVQSIAFPALSALDSKLHSLIFTPEQSLDQVAQVDPKAADMLHTCLTGYASLRRFYDLRDEEVTLKEGQKSKSRPLARNNAAATALLAVINSAADNIHGGLYDKDRGAVVQVDGLLALLGEAMVFVNRACPSQNIPFSHMLTTVQSPKSFCRCPDASHFCKRSKTCRTSHRGSMPNVKNSSAPPSPRAKAGPRLHRHGDFSKRQ